MRQPPSLTGVADALTTLGPAVVGQRLRRTRLRQGLSVRDLAGAAGMSKTSVVRLEAGEPVRPSTVLRACRALGLHVGRLADLSDEGTGPVAVHRLADDRWADMADPGGPLLSAHRPLTPDERARAVADGASSPINILRARLPEGRVSPSVLELYGPSELRSHVGEEFVYVLAGRVRLEVGGRAYELAEGEAMTFWSAERHRYAPADADAVPARLLSVRVDG